jgi:hypothetical protein
MTPIIVLHSVCAIFEHTNTLGNNNNNRRIKTFAN